jgi:hypothetical protein
MAEEKKGISMGEEFEVNDVRCELLLDAEDVYMLPLKVHIQMNCEAGQKKKKKTKGKVW